MSRPPRVQVPGGVYHVNAGATHEGLLFRDSADRAEWLKLLGVVVERFRWECFMYCLLSTHYHLVIRIAGPTLAAGMQYLNARHAENVNWRYGRRGHAFGARYHSELVETDSHALEVARYVPLNAVRAGLVRRPEEWPWSSYPATLGLKRGPSWLTSEWVLGLFGVNPARARERYRDFVDEELVHSVRGPSTGSDPVEAR